MRKGSFFAASSPPQAAGYSRLQNKAFSEELKRRIYGFILGLVKFIETLSKNYDLCRIARNQSDTTDKVGGLMSRIASKAIVIPNHRLVVNGNNPWSFSSCFLMQPHALSNPNSKAQMPNQAQSPNDKNVVLILGFGFCLE